MQEFTDSLNSLEVPCGFIHLLSRPTEALHNSEGMLLLIPRNVKAKIRSQIMQLPLPPSLECIQELGQSFISGIAPNDLQRQLIEKTHLQSECVRWHEECYFRLTASNFGHVIQQKSEFIILH